MFQSVVALEPDRVQDNLKCVVCMELSVDPVIIAATCEHMFCRECVEQAFHNCNDDTKCPACRNELLVPGEKTRELEGISRRVWGEIKVQCAGHRTCEWTGDVSDALPHVSTCQAASVARLEVEKQFFKRKVEELETSNAHLTIQEENSRAHIESLETAYECARASAESLRSHCNMLEAEALELKSKVASLTGRLQRQESHKKPRLASDPDGHKKEDVGNEKENEAVVNTDDDDNFSAAVEVVEPNHIHVKTSGTTTNVVDGNYRRADVGLLNGAPVYVMERRGTRVLKFSVFVGNLFSRGRSHQGRVWYISTKFDGVENYIWRCESSDVVSVFPPRSGWQLVDASSAAANAGARTLTVSYVFDKE